MNTGSQIETKTKIYTTSELANLYDVTVDPISVLVRRQNLRPIKIGQSSAKHYDTGALKQLRLHYAKSKPKRDKINNTQDLRTQLAVVQPENQLLRDQLEPAKSITEILQDELEIENSQIDKLQDLTNQAQQLDLATYTQHQELLKQKSQPTNEPTKYKYEIFNWF